MAWWTTALVSALVVFLIALFFRDPEREMPATEDEWVSPADGVVTLREDTLQEIPGVGSCRKLSIFLSVFDVHLNRMPYGGTVVSSTHTPGKFLDARDPQSGIANENRLWVFTCHRGRFGIRQIAGLIARRIVDWKKVGGTVDKGDRLGLIRFGSRTDLYIPENAEFTVNVGDRVWGCYSVVARWKA